MDLKAWSIVVRRLKGTLQTTQPLFPHRGQPLDECAALRAWLRVRPAEKRHPHALKHSLASHLVAENVNLALVKQALGHRSIKSTMKYIGVTDSQAARETSRALTARY